MGARPAYADHRRRGSTAWVRARACVCGGRKKQLTGHGTGRQGLLWISRCFLMGLGRGFYVEAGPFVFRVLGVVVCATLMFTYEEGMDLFDTWIS